jgi:hypothetical protein
VAHHHPSVKLFHESNLLGVRLLVSARVINLFDLGDRLLWVLILKDLRFDVATNVGLFIVCSSSHGHEQSEMCQDDVDDAKT